MFKHASAALFASFALWAPAVLADASAAAWSLLRPGTVLLMRHAQAPGTGDPPGFVLGDCATQRNLDERGRQQARSVGEGFRRRGIAVGAVLSSQWCRARETATLAFPGQVTELAALNSFFDDRGPSDEQTREARQRLADWRGPGVLVVVSHQVNITALTGVYPASGEGIVLQPRDGRLEVLGRIAPGSTP